MILILRVTCLDKDREESTLQSITKTLQAFIESSSLGEFHSRLQMLLVFHCHVLLVLEEEKKGMCCFFSLTPPPPPLWCKSGVFGMFVAYRFPKD